MPPTIGLKETNKIKWDNVPIKPTNIVLS